MSGRHDHCRRQWGYFLCLQQQAVSTRTDSWFRHIARHPATVTSRAEIFRSDRLAQASSTHSCHLCSADQMILTSDWDLSDSQVFKGPLSVTCPIVHSWPTVRSQVQNPTPATLRRKRPKADLADRRSGHSSCDVALPNRWDEPFEIPTPGHRLHGFLKNLRLQGFVAQQRRL